MVKIYKFFLIILFFILSLDVVKGQENTKPPVYSKFEKIQQDILSAKDRRQAFVLSQKYIEISKAEENSKELLKAYGNAAGTATDSIGLKYGDSILNLAIKLKDQAAIGFAYNTIANTSLVVSDYKKSAEFSVISYDYFISQQKDDLARKCLLTIGKLKSLIGEDESAQKLFKDQYLYFKKNQTDSDSKLWYSFYLNSLIITNAKLKKHKENESLIKESYQFYQTNKDLNSSKFQVFITDAINDFYMGKYTSSIIKVNEAFDLMNSTNYRIPDEFNFLLAKCYWKSGQIEKAFPIFKEITDRYFKIHKAPLSFRPAFDFFTEYYKKNGTTEQQLASMNDLLEFDKYERDIRKNVQIKLKDFDENYKAEEEYNEQKLSSLLSYVIILLSSLAVIYYVYKKIKAHTKSSMIELSEVENLNNAKIPTENSETKFLEIHSEEKFDYSLYRPINKLTVDQIIKAMNAFESSLGFLEKDLKLTSLAQKFSTNDKYLSKIIKIKTGKTFNAYLTDLRFDYLERMLQDDTQFRNQKIKDIATKLGFGSPEFFATAFKEKYGKSPKEFFEVK